MNSVDVTVRTQIPGERISLNRGSMTQITSLKRHQHTITYFNHEAPFRFHIPYYLNNVVEY